MTGEDVERSARPLLNDEQEPYSFNADPMWRFINEAVDLITSMRPDALIDTDNSLITVTDLTALSDTISIANKWKVPVVDYVVSRCYGMKSDGKDNAERAAHYLTRFTTLVMQV